MKNIQLFFGACIIVGFLSSCATTQQTARPNQQSVNKYTASFPTKDVSDQLVAIQQSVKRITSKANFRIHFFNNQNLTLKEIRQSPNIGKLASKNESVQRGIAGTAVAILRNDNHIALVTARHVVSFPDTIVTYKQGKNIPQHKFVASIGIKKKQNNYLIYKYRLLTMHKIAEDKKHDLALIDVPVEGTKVDIPPLDITYGHAKRLQVGSFIYIFGYPLGAEMVTRGIVSKPNYDGRGSFLTDAIFNHGISGGLIAASDNNFRTFQWVGMAVTASATQQQVLIPNPNNGQDYYNHQAYTDTAYVSKKKTINYGLTSSTPVDQILAFLIQNEAKLKKIGLSVSNLQ